MKVSLTGEQLVQAVREYVTNHGLAPRDADPGYNLNWQFSATVTVRGGALSYNYTTLGVVVDVPTPPPAPTPPQPPPTKPPTGHLN